jgi:RNA polymerase sigma factor (sigma-70 family)
MVIDVPLCEVAPCSTGPITRHRTCRSGDGRGLPYCVCHPSFEGPDAEWEYGEATTPADDPLHLKAHMPDAVTRDLSGRMHYAAYRWRVAVNPAEAGRWRDRYHALRDRIVLGNRKLVFRVVRGRSQDSDVIDDLTGECDIVLIKAVAAYNPWLGNRFSTYAYICLLRALARRRRRLGEQRLTQLHGGDWSVVAAGTAGQEAETWQPWREYLREDDSLLSPREKRVLKRRYQLDGRDEKPTLERLGRELGLSKERVRQLELSAVDKLRRVLLADPD